MACPINPSKSIVSDNKRKTSFEWQQEISPAIMIDNSKPDDDFPEDNHLLDDFLEAEEELQTTVEDSNMKDF